MSALLQVVLPVFLVIGAGFAATRWRLFPDSGVDGMIQFVVRFAVPCLLFLAMYRLDLAAAFDARMIVAFYVGALSCFTIGVVVARRFGRRPGEAVAIGFGAYFSNTVLLGLPIMIRAYGEAATEPMFAIIAFHAPALYTIGVVAMEVARRDGAGAQAAMARAARSIVTNALMIGIFAGLALNLLGLGLPAALIDAADMLAGATLPAALFALGAALTRYRLQAEIGWALGIAALSLVAHPAITYALTVWAFDLPIEMVRGAVVTAAMPAGLNVYVFAAMYRRAEGAAAGAVLLSTALGLLTISGWLALLGGAG